MSFTDDAVEWLICLTCKRPMAPLMEHRGRLCVKGPHYWLIEGNFQCSSCGALRTFSGQKVSELGLSPRK